MTCCSHLPTRGNWHRSDSQLADCSMFVSARRARSSSILVAPRRRRAPPSSCITAKPALLAERRRKFVKEPGKGSSHDNKEGPIFHENEVFWHTLQRPGTGAGQGGPGGPPISWSFSLSQMPFTRGHWGPTVPGVTTHNQSLDTNDRVISQ